MQDGGQLGRNPWCKAGQGRSDVFLPKIQGDPGVTTRKVIHFVITVAHEVSRVGRVEHGGALRLGVTWLCAFCGLCVYSLIYLVLGAGLRVFARVCPTSNDYQFATIFFELV